MRLHQHGAIVLGIDYSEEAIRICKSRYPNPPNIGISFEQQNILTVKGKWDVAVSQGTLEHLDYPYEAMHYVMENLLVPDGKFIFSCPNFVNPRGYVSLAIEAFAGQRVGGSDIHWIFPGDVHNFALEHNYTLKFKTCDEDWGCGGAFLYDMKYRFKDNPNVDQTKVEYLIERLNKLLCVDKPTAVNGATAIYTLSKK